MSYAHPEQSAFVGKGGLIEFFPRLIVTDTSSGAAKKRCGRVAQQAKHKSENLPPELESDTGVVPGKFSVAAGRGVALNSDGALVVTSTSTAGDGVAGATASPVRGAVV